jgi:hypothetical protein
MILLAEFLELIGNDPTCLPLTHDEYRDLRDQEKLERMLTIQKLEVKFNDNPNKKTATALSNARNNCTQTPVEIAWKNSPEFQKVKQEKILRERHEMMDLVNTLNNF